METIEQKLRDEAKRLLTEKKADVVIGYEMGTLPLVATPCFITAPEDADRLVYNPLCVQNLAAFVTDVLHQHRDSQKRTPVEKRTKKVVGVVARGCTSRSLVIHLQERQYGRDEVVILGVPCSGYVDQRKIAARLDNREIIEGSLTGDAIRTKTGAGEQAIAITEVLADNCRACPFNNPVISDILVGEKAPPMDANGEYATVEEFAKLSQKERWGYFVKEMDKCIRCYACRNACPSCYCRSCFAEQSQPQWIGVGAGQSDSQMFQIMRMYHMAGRCVDCGSCTAVCPMGVDLRTYLKKLDLDGWRMFEHRAGRTLEEPALLGTFKEHDPQDFIFEPE